jgi:hypothetical protein
MFRRTRALMKVNKELYPLFICVYGTVIGAGTLSIFHFAPQLQWTKNHRDEAMRKLNNYL